MEKYTSFRQFYPFYLSQHQNVVCRRLHFIGSALVLLLLGGLIWHKQWPWLPSVLLVGYGFAWVGHFFFERNKPATFTYPLYSFMGDWVMFFDFLTGRQKI